MNWGSNWGSASEFFAMGGYGLYVWGSYGVTLAVMALEVLLTRQRHRRATAAVASLNLEPDHEGDRPADPARGASS